MSNPMNTQPATHLPTRHLGPFEVSAIAEAPDEDGSAIAHTIQCLGHRG